MEPVIIAQFPNEEPYEIELNENSMQSALIIIKGHEKEIYRLRGEIKRLRETLEFYANPYGKCKYVPDFYSELSFGETAEDALKEGE